MGQFEGADARSRLWLPDRKVFPEQMLHTMNSDRCILPNARVHRLSIDNDPSTESYGCVYTLRCNDLLGIHAKGSAAQTKVKPIGNQ